MQLKVKGRSVCALTKTQHGDLISSNLPSGKKGQPQKTATQNTSYFSILEMLFTVTEEQHRLDNPLSYACEILRISQSLHLTHCRCGGRRERGRVVPSHTLHAVVLTIIINVKKC